MKSKTPIFIIVMLLSVMLNIFLLIPDKVDKSNKSDSVKVINPQQVNTINFLSLFVEKVLKADGAVKFEDRLRLENDVRSLNNPKILNEWQKFVASKSNADAQINLKNLLSVLVNDVKSGSVSE